MPILTWLGGILVKIGVDKLIDLIKNIANKVKAYNKADKQAEQSAQSLKDAKTGAEVDKATDDILNRL